MKYTPKSIKKILKECIKEMATHPQLYCSNPEKDFTRKRKLPFEQIMRFVLAMTGKSLRGEMMDFFHLSPSMPTVSAFIQQRSKINYRAFEALFHTFTDTIDELDLFKGYRVLAVDGSDLHTPTNMDEKSSFHPGVHGQKAYNLFHLNVLYDVQRKIYTDAIVQGRMSANEHRAFVTMVDRASAFVPTIYMADRGYESYNNMAHIIEKGQRFLIRAKDIGKHGIVSSLSLPNTAEFDVPVHLGLTRRQTKETVSSNLKFIPQNSTFDYLPLKPNRHDSICSYHISFRVVRFRITDDTYEVLLTNLSENEFSAVDLKDLYAMRWGIETSFRDLKYTLALSYFHSKKTENIFQEIFAKLTMYNFAELITSHVVVKQKSRKLPYKINFAAAVHICRNFFLKNISPPDVEALLLSHLLPIRHGLSTPRGRPYRSAPCFIYRIP